jgi:TetR/AcrR family transcriptional regulator, regulator of autoinduction and epiphytic fitness
VSSVNPGKPARRYSSRLREQQAAATRRAVLDAAATLFRERGYGATTIEQIAARAGVSKPTVFTAVGNKQTLLSVVRDVTIAGDDDPIPVSRRPAAAGIADEPDQQRAAELIAAHLTAVAGRYAPIYEVLRGAAAAGEPELQELWRTEEHQRLIGARHWIDVLATKGRLRDDLQRDTAADIMWLLMAPDNYTRLVHGRGWPPGRYEQWLTDAIRSLCSSRDD